MGSRSDVGGGCGAGVVVARPRARSCALLSFRLRIMIGWMSNFVHGEEMCILPRACDGGIDLLRLLSLACETVVERK